jgi:hypothetical protein
MRGFNSRETEINQHYWSFIASSEHSAYRARKYKEVDKSAPTSRLFRAGGTDAPRIPSTVSDWLSANEELKNWLRLSALVSAASNFEMFLGHIARTALASDPLVRHGSSKALDGVSLLKGGLELPYEDVAEGLTKGDWNSREAHFLKIFGVMLLEIRNKKTELEAIRKMRNEFAHGFGRSLEVPEPGMLSTSRSTRLTQGQLKKYLGVISSVAKSIDRHLMDNHIGYYELLVDYHKVKSDLTNEAQIGNSSIESYLKRRFYNEFGITVAEKFCRDLIGYYELCPRVAGN